MAGRTKRTLQAALLLPLVFLAASPLDLTRFLCSMDGALRDRCCCPSPVDPAAEAAATPAAAPLAEIGAPPCCALDRVAVTEIAAEPPRSPAQALGPIVWVQVAEARFDLLPPVAAHTPMSQPRLTAHGPPLRLLTQVFLI